MLGQGVANGVGNNGLHFFNKNIMPPFMKCRGQRAI